MILIKIEHAYINPDQVVGIWEILQAGETMTDIRLAGGNQYPSRVIVHMPVDKVAALVADSLGGEIDR